MFISAENATGEPLAEISNLRTLPVVLCSGLHSLSVSGTLANKYEFFRDPCKLAGPGSVAGIATGYATRPS